MSFQNMIQEGIGTIAGSSLGLIRTKLNEAFLSIQNENVWSFQCITGGFLTPGLLGANGNNGVAPSQFLSPGTISIQPYTNQLLGDAIATRTWLQGLFTPPIITQYQFRVPYYSLYSAIALQYAGTVAYVTVTFKGSGQTPGQYLLDGEGGTGSGAQILVTVNDDGFVDNEPEVISAGNGYSSGGTAFPPSFTLAAGGTPASFQAVLNAIIVLDRPWMEPAQFNSGYMAYQAYFPAPPGFKRWYALRDTTNNNHLDFWSKTQVDLAREDAERLIFDQPFYVVPFQSDIRPGSATYGQMLYELWPHPITMLPYTWHCQADWPALNNPSDTLPFPLTEELVKFKMYEAMSLWKEGQKGDEMERGSGSNWQFLSKAFHAEYTNRLKQCRNMDRNLVDLYFTKARLGPPYGGEPYSTVNGLLNVGY